MMYKIFVYVALICLCVHSIPTYYMVKDLWEYHALDIEDVPKNDEWDVTLHCQELADTEEEYDTCKRLRKRYETPLIVYPRGAGSPGDVVAGR